MGTHPVFTPQEFAGRLRRTRDALAARGVAAGVFDECEAMSWLTGYGNSENRWRCVVVPVEGEPFIVIRALDATPCRDRSAVGEIGTFLDWQSPEPVLAGMLAERGLDAATIGFDYGSTSFTAKRFLQCQTALNIDP